MHIRYRLLGACFLLFSVNVLSQDMIRCETPAYSAAQRQAYGPNPEEEAMYGDIFRYVNEWKNARGQNSTSTVTVIPVVVHVVWNTTAQNITRAQILSQIDVLNQDFARLNSDTAMIPAIWRPLAVNTNIQFCLATRKANGDWTDGIERRQTSVTQFTTGGVDSVKFYAFGGLDAWDYTQYLNIWVINFANNVLGITQMPLAGPGSTDGVCIQYNAFGKGAFPLLTNYNKGRTATHEVGHWLGLRHIWGDDNGWCYGTDSCSDTPNQAREHFNCPTFPSVDSCSPTSPGTMYVNYMDYSYDRCLLMFTPEQAQRMNAQFSSFRSGLVTSQGCLPPIGIPEYELDNFLSVYPNPSHDILNIALDFPFPGDVAVSLFDALGREVYKNEIPPHAQLQVPVSSLAGGIYSLRLVGGGQAFSKTVCIRH